MFAAAFEDSREAFAAQVVRAVVQMHVTRRDCVPTVDTLMVQAYSIAVLRTMHAWGVDE